MIPDASKVQRGNLKELGKKKKNPSPTGSPASLQAGSEGGSWEPGMGPGAREERGQRGTSPRGDGHTASQSCGGSTGHPRAPYSPPNPTLLPHSPAEMLQRGRVQLPVFSAGCRMRLRALCLWGGWRDRLVIRGRDTGPSPAGVPKLRGQTPAPAVGPQHGE